MRIVAQASIAALLLLAMTFAAAAQAGAIRHSAVRIRNETDKYVWVTAYSNPSGSSTQKLGSWCIAPGVKNDAQVFAGEIKDVRVEVSAGGCQHNPMLLDRTLDVAAREIAHDKINFWGMVNYAGGVLSYTH